MSVSASSVGLGRATIFLAQVRFGLPVIWPLSGSVKQFWLQSSSSCQFWSIFEVWALAKIWPKPSYWKPLAHGPNFGLGFRPYSALIFCCQILRPAYVLTCFDYYTLFSQIKVGSSIFLAMNNVHFFHPYLLMALII